MRKRIRIVFNGVEVVNTTKAWRHLETSHPPSYYIPPGDIAPDVLQPSLRRSYCEWKGQACYVTLCVGDKRAEDVGWFYPDPAASVRELRDHVAFYAGPMDACYVGEERVEPQPGGFYGGWITSDLVGPFKGERGTEFW